MESEDKKVKNLDDIIGEAFTNKLQMVRNLFNNFVTSRLLSEKFCIEDTVRNNTFKKFFVFSTIEPKKDFKKTTIDKDMYTQMLNDAKTGTLKKQDDAVIELVKFYNKYNGVGSGDEETGGEYDFISQFVSLDDYFNSEDGEIKKNVFYKKVKSSLDQSNGDGIGFAGFTTFRPVNDERIDSSDALIKALGNFNSFSNSNGLANIMMGSLKNFATENNFSRQELEKITQSEKKINEEHKMERELQSYIKSKMYGHEDDLLSILDAIATVNLELCMKELDELIKSEEAQKNKKENEKENKNVINAVNEAVNGNAIEIKFKDIKKQLKHRVKLLGFDSSDTLCKIIDKVSTEPINQFKDFVCGCQEKFDEYQKEYGFIQANDLDKANKDLEAKRLELRIIKDFNAEAIKQAEKIFKQNKKDKEDNPEILSVGFVLGLLGKQNLDVILDKKKSTEKRYAWILNNYTNGLESLVAGIDQFSERGNFGFENLQSVFNSMSNLQAHFGKDNLVDLDSVKKFYNLVGKIDDNHSKKILNAIDGLRGDQQVEDFLCNILNKKRGDHIAIFFDIAFNKKQDDKEKLEDTKGFLLGIVDQAFKNYNDKEENNKFLSYTFKRYFTKKIGDVKTIDDLEQTITSVENFIKNDYLHRDPKTSLDVLIEEASTISMMNKNNLEWFFGYVKSLTKDMHGVNGYENRKLLVDLEDIFLDGTLNSRYYNIGSVVNLLKKLDAETDDNKCTKDDFFQLRETLYIYEQKSIRDKIKNNFPLLEATLAYQAHYGLRKFAVNEKQNLFKRLVEIKKNGLQDQDKKDLTDYFWDNAGEIRKYKLEKAFTTAEANELYEFISDESKNNPYFKLLVGAIGGLGLNDGKSISEMLDQDDNFKNILTLKNGKGEEAKNAYKSILKSLVKQKLNQKSGFVSNAYLKHYEKKINDNEIKDELQNEIVNGVNSVLDDKFQTDNKILIESVNDLKDNNSLSDFWNSCRKTEKIQAEEKNKNEKDKEIINTDNKPVDSKNENKDINDTDKVLSELSDIFTDLLELNNKEIDNKDNDLIIIINNQPLEENNKNDLSLIDTTKKFVNQLFQSNEKDKNDNIVNINTNGNKEDDKVGEDDTGIINVLNKYYSTCFDDSKKSLSGATKKILEYQIKHFYEFNNDQKIKFLKCMKNVKNNKLTNDDLRNTNLYFYKNRKYLMHNITDLTLQNINLTIDEDKKSDTPDQILSSFFKKSSLFKNKKDKNDKTKTIKEEKEEDERLVTCVIENVGKKQITNLEDQSNFGQAILYVLNEQIQDLDDAYKKNDYNKIDLIKKQKDDWKTVISALRWKGFISDEQEQSFYEQIDHACNLNTLITVGEWILSALASIFVVPLLVSKTIRKTLHSPFKSRQTRYLLESVKSVNGNNGIFSMIYKIANSKIPLQASDEQNKNELQ